MASHNYEIDISYPDYWCGKSIEDVIKQAYNFFKRHKGQYKLIYQKQEEEE